MIPPYDITPEILKRITSISEKIGEINANYLAYPSPQLRRENKIKTIHSSLKIEGNNLTEEQVTALLSVRPYSRVSRLEASLARLPQADEKRSPDISCRGEYFQPLV